MAYTITIDEVQNVREEATDKLTVMIKNYILRNDICAKLNRSYIETVQRLIVYKSMLEGWEQGKFTNQEYTNYMSSNEYLNLVHKIKNDKLKDGL